MRILLRRFCVPGLAALVAVACGASEPEPSPQAALSPVAAQTAAEQSEPSRAVAPATYEMTHSDRDAEFVLSWDLIASNCRDAGQYQVTGVFAQRGETVAISPQESLSVEQDAPFAWISQRFVRADDPASGRSIGVTVSFFDGPGTAGEYLKGLAAQMGATVVEIDSFTEASVDTEAPLRSAQRFTAGNGMIVHLIETAAPGASFFCEPATLDDLVSLARGNMALVTATPSP